MPYQRGFAQIIVLVGGLLLLAIGGYVATSDQAKSSVFSFLPFVSTDTVPVKLAADDQVPPSDTPSPTPPVVKTQTQTETPKSPPPATQTFDAVIHDVKYFFDTVQVPAAGYVRSGYKNEVRVRGKLIAIKPEGLCQTAPCPVASKSEYRYVIEDAQDYIQNSKYRISIRKTGDPVATGLTEGQVYVFTGTLEHSFNTADQVSFLFDPKSAE